MIAKWAKQADKQLRKDEKLRQAIAKKIALNKAANHDSARKL